MPLFPEFRMHPKALSFALLTVASFGCAAVCTESASAQGLSERIKAVGDQKR